MTIKANQGVKAGNSDPTLLPLWLKVGLGVVLALVISAYFSADMRAVFAAAWAMCV